jgi:hypothetical protein
MEQHPDIVTKASEFVFDLFKSRLSEHLVYHTFGHTEEVARTAGKIGRGMKLGEEGIEVVLLAAWFHDTGYTELYRGHEEVSVRIATEFLEKERYAKEKIELVTGCIRATKVPQQPKNLLEEIVADADLAGLGKKSFFEKTELLHTELENVFGTSSGEEDWIKQNIALLGGHTYFTSYARETYGSRHEENSRILNKKLNKLIASKTEVQTTAITSHFPDLAPEKDLRLGRNSQVMFKLLSNSLLADHQQADGKALIIILANTILVFAALIGFATIGRHHLHALILSSLLLLSSVIPIVFSALAIRLHSRRISPKNYHPLFGGFYSKTTDDLQQILGEATEENEPLPFGTEADDFFEQRMIVARKYRYLRLSYTTFMYGFSLTALTFLVFLILR